MSNCIKLPSVSVHLRPVDFDYAKLQVNAPDLDGNQLQVDEEGVSLFFAELTTWRELAWFVANRVAPASVNPGSVRVDIPGTRDESDGFRKAFRLTVVLNAKEPKDVLQG